MLRGKNKINAVTSERICLFDKTHDLSSKFILQTPLIFHIFHQLHTTDDEWHHKISHLFFYPFFIVFL